MVETALVVSATYRQLLEKPVLSIEECARLFDCNHKTIREMVSAGELPHVRVGRVKRIPTSAVRKWLHHEESAQLADLVAAVEAQTEVLVRLVRVLENSVWRSADEKG